MEVVAVEAFLETLMVAPDLLYLIVIVAAWAGVLALFMPGTGFIEVVAGIGLLLGFGGLAASGASVIGLILIGLSFVGYALAVLRQFSSISLNKALEGLPLSGGAIALIATVLQIIGGVIIVAQPLALSWWLVVGLGLASWAVYRWMLLPTVSALKPPPQSGAEALIGELAEVRTPPAAPGKPAMVYLNGELWQAITQDELAEGDQVEVLARDGMRLHVQKPVTRTD
jgi:membrane-bound serine protease (ClpP class)